jgi:hypothetical protein
MGSKPRSIETSLLRGSACKAGGPGETRSGEGSTYGTVTRKGEGRSGTLDGYYWVREVQSGPPLGPSRSKGSEAGCRLSSDSSRGSKCPPPRFLRRGRAAGRRRSVLNGDSRRIGVAESSRSRRARWGSMDVSVGMFGEPSRWQTALEAVKSQIRARRCVRVHNGIRLPVIPQVGRIFRSAERRTTLGPIPSCSSKPPASAVAGAGGGVTMRGWRWWSAAAHRGLR